jgi:hypothetical protein
MRRIPVVLALVLFALAAVVPTAAPAQTTTRTEEELRRLYTGAWFLTVSTSSARGTIDRAIERAVGEMNYFVQSIARDQLTENTRLNERLDIDFPSGNIRISFDQRYTYECAPGVVTDFDIEGSGTVHIRHYFRDGHLEEYFDAALGQRWNVYELDAAGTTMTVTATQQGPMMPSPMTFALSYRQRT